MLNRIAEFVLALFASPGRATAILGDLTEMAATRGRLWFIAAYTRTLFTFTWRIVLALFVADIGRQLAFDTFHLYLRHTPAVWRNATGSWLDLLNHTGPLLACIMSTLWFALFFALVRYGRRDAFVRLTALVTAGAFLAFLAIPWVSLAAAAATLALACVALLSNRWRKPFEVLAWTGAAGLLALAAFAVLSRQFLSQHPAIAHSLSSHPFIANALVFSFQGSLLLVAIVCSRLHRLLLETSPTGRTPA
ncbi:MAG: hypothetical protein ABSG84_13295 [Acidobacteriaceae bacterium]|jgi:hypothetical protein